MSTLKVTNIQHPSAADPAIELNAAGGALIGGQAAYARNLLYNGAMQVAQRGTSVTGSTAGAFVADRFSTAIVNQGTWTLDIQNDAPTGSGLRKSSRVLCTTADAAPAASDLIIFSQLLEGQDLQRIAKGTSSAQKLTLSFWVKSNVTGTYIADLLDTDNTRQVSASYTISASATWEKKTITFPADTTGAFDNDNALSLRVRWWLGAGSDYTSGTLATTWASTTAANMAVGQTNLAAATNNYWQITGVQLEVGPVATPFEFKSYGQELRECQRYYWRNTSDTAYGFFALGSGTSSTATAFTLQHPVPMRAAPTVLETATLAAADNVNPVVALTSASLVATQTTKIVSYLQGGSASGITQYRPYNLVANNSTSAYIGVSAEL